MDRAFLRNIDFRLLTPALILLMLSLITLFSLNFNLFKNQLFFSALSIFAFLLFSLVNQKIVKLYGLHIYIVSILLLFTVLLLGEESRGAVRWIEFAGIRIQFSEILKPFLALSLASFLVNRKTSVGNFFLIFILFFPIFFLIFLQPDLGNALIYGAILILALILFGFPLRFFIAGVIFLAILFPFIFRFLHEYQRQRLLTFINPSSDPLGASYNSIQAIIAVGSGMLWGKGIGGGTQSGLRFLPERHTDFIFATISEQLGFIGATVIVACFAFILYRIFIIYQNSQDSFSKVFAGISFFLILIQFFVNIGMNIGLLPVVGVTLPFVSYGGSSLLSSFILLGLLSSTEKLEREEVLEIR